MIDKKKKRKKIAQRIRKNINGTGSIPRLSVFRSNNQIYCQVVDDLKGITIASASSKEGVDGVTRSEQAFSVGKAVADKLKAQNIDQVVFDRNGYLYHGRVKALAEGAREGGLKL